MDSKTILKYGALGVGIILTTDIVKISGNYIISKKKKEASTSAASAASLIPSIDKNLFVARTSALLVPTCFLGAIINTVSDLVRGQLCKGYYLYTKDIIRDVDMSKRNSGLIIVAGVCFGLVSIFFYTARTPSTQNKELSIPKKVEFHENSVQSIYPHLSCVGQVHPHSDLLPELPQLSDF
jgi:hypothetical protein